jgi:hypothetical protein
MLNAIAGGSLTTVIAANSVIPTSISLGGVGGGFAVKVFGSAHGFQQLVNSVAAVLAELHPI